MSALVTAFGVTETGPQDAAPAARFAECRCAPGARPGPRRPAKGKGRRHR
jgi:hypothetical protein